MADPLDFTDRYNTPLPDGLHAAYEQWAKANGQDPVRGKYDYDLQGAFLANAGQDPKDRGHFTDAFKKPNHPTFSDQSQYNGLDGYVGGTWTPKGYVPSQTNVTFRPLPMLQAYFARVEPGTPLLMPSPVPKPTGANGIYRIGDLISPKF